MCTMTLDQVSVSCRASITVVEGTWEKSLPGHRERKRFQWAREEEAAMDQLRRTMHHLFAV